MAEGVASPAQMGPSAAHATGSFSTQRNDLWWLEPLGIVVLFAAFVVYSFARILEGTWDASHRYFEVHNAAYGYHYLSPFGTPDLTPWVPSAVKDLGFVGVFFTNPAFLILPFPAGFRFTCYYYRKAYYRSFVARPAACGVEAVKGKKYQGEKRIMIFQNIHRYFLYAAILITFFLAWDAIQGIWAPGHWDDATQAYAAGGHHWYFGVGNAIMVLNVVLLCAYTFGCHSLRHLVGGKLDCYSCDAISQTRYSWWQYVTKLNQRHMLFALTSLVSVGATDVYIRWLGVMQASGRPVIGFHLLWLKDLVVPA